MAFHDIQFPADISRGAISRTRRLSDIVTLRSGAEMVNTVWQNSRHEYDIGVGIRKLNHVYEIIAFYEARMGRMHNFRFKDWADYKSCLPNEQLSATDQNMVFIGVKEGTTTVGIWQLAKTYGDSAGSYTRTIKKPVVGTVITSPSVNQNKIDYSNGTIEFSNRIDPDNPPTAGFAFDVPVRFADDTLDASVDLYNAGSLQAINLIEVMI